MKKILKLYFIEIVVLYFLNLQIKGLTFEKGYETFFLTALALTLATYLAKPVINVLLLPINLLTFGLFRWLSSAIAIYLVTLIVPGFKLSGFFYQGFSTLWFDIPTLNFSGVMAFIAFSFLISILVSILHWLLK